MKLPKYVVGVDLETTSLDPREGEIIEVAAIRYELDKGVEAERFVKLCKPVRGISTETKAITGITQEMVEGQPVFKEIKDELSEFIGEDVVFAHNASFDIGWLDMHGVELKANSVWDTFWLAATAWPEASSYNLGSLAGDLGIEVEGEHRAGGDVVMTWGLLQAIRKRLELVEDDLERIFRVLDKSDLEHWRPLFSVVGRQPRVNSPHPTPLPGKGEGSSPKEILGEGGVLDKNWPGFKYRKVQLEMAEWVSGIMNEGKVGLIEAPTGVGKTFGYLTPLMLSLPHPSRSEARSSLSLPRRGESKKVVVSTYTKNLQDQLIRNDVPKLLEALKFDFKVAGLKGRSNYLCTTCLDKLLKEDKFKPEEGWFLVKLLVWLAQGGDGDLEQINISHQTPYLLRRINAGGLDCRISCKSGRCPYQKAVSKAKEADLLIVNHALLVNGLAGEEFSHTVIDEAHHLAEVAREATRIDLSKDRVDELVYHAKHLVKNIEDNKGSIKRRIKEEGDQLVDLYNDFLKEVGLFIQKHSRDEYVLRISEGVRQNSSWQSLYKQGHSWLAKLQFFKGLLESTDVAPLARLIEEVSSTHSALSQWIDGNGERIQWALLSEPRYGSNDQVSAKLFDVALVPAPVVSSLVERSGSVVLTSATLTTNNSFEYIKEVLGIESADEIKLSSSFDYQKQMMIYVVDDGPTPKDADYDQFTSSLLSNISILLGGRTLALFTSYGALKNVYRLTLDTLYKANIKLLAQRMTGGRQKILSKFMNQRRITLMGTSSFWEGVDIPGEALSCLVMPRLPWPVPTDPVLDALAEAQGVKPFEERSLPEMLLRLRQGVGRLIRSEDDRGVVVVLDSRWLGSSYHQKVLTSMPAATFKIGGANELEKTLTEWFGKEELEKWQTDKVAQG